MVDGSRPISWYHDAKVVQRPPPTLDKGWAGEVFSARPTFFRSTHSVEFTQFNQIGKACTKVHECVFSRRGNHSGCVVLPEHHNPPADVRSSRDTGKKKRPPFLEAVGPGLLAPGVVDRICDALQCTSSQTRSQDIFLHHDLQNPYTSMLKNVRRHSPEAVVQFSAPFITNEQAI